MTWILFIVSDPNKPAEKFVSFFIKGKALPPDLAATVSANYTSASGLYSF